MGQTAALRPPSQKPTSLKSDKSNRSVHDENSSGSSVKSLVSSVFSRKSSTKTDPSGCSSSQASADGTVVGTLRKSLELTKIVEEDAKDVGDTLIEIDLEDNETAVAKGADVPLLQDITSAGGARRSECSSATTQQQSLPEPEAKPDETPLAIDVHIKSEPLPLNRKERTSAQERHLIRPSKSRSEDRTIASSSYKKSSRAAAKNLISQQHQGPKESKNLTGPKTASPKPPQRPTKSFGRRLSRFLCASANPLDEDSLYEPAVESYIQRPQKIQASTRAIALHERSTRSGKRSKLHQNGMQPHPDGNRNMYVPRYASQGHSRTTMGKKPHKGRGASAMAPPRKKRRRHRRRVDSVLDVEHTGSAPPSQSTPLVPSIETENVDWSSDPPKLHPESDWTARFSSTVSMNPLSLDTPSSRRLNPKLHRTHIAAPDHEKMQASLPTKEQTKHRSRHSDRKPRSSRAQVSQVSIPEDVPYSTASSSRTEQPRPSSPIFVTRKTDHFSRDVPLIKQVIEEEQTPSEYARRKRRIRRARHDSKRKREEHETTKIQKQEQILAALDKIIEKEHKIEARLEKMSFGLYKSKVRRAMVRLEKDGALKSMLESRPEDARSRRRRKKYGTLGIMEGTDSTRARWKASRKGQKLTSTSFTIGGKTVNGA